MIAAALTGQDATDQETVDQLLSDADGTPDRGRLGGNAIVATSMAVLHAAAAAAGEPLWRHLSGGRPVRIPLPEIQIFGGGAHAQRRVDVQDFMVMCPAAGSFTEALDWTAEIYRAAGGLLRRAEPGRHGDRGACRAARRRRRRVRHHRVRPVRETEDVTIAHLAVGWNAGQLKVGSFSRSERMAKWNEVLRIEEALGPAATVSGWSALPTAHKGLPVTTP